MRIRTLISLTAIAIVQAQSTVPRFAVECGLFSNKIYCYGGARGNFTYELPIDTSMYTLDLAQNATMSDLASAWQLINTNTNGVIIDARVYPQSAQISDTQLLMSGGFNTLLVDAIQDQTIVYDTSSNSWSSYPNYTEGTYGNRQIYFASSSIVPGKGAAFYGGFEEHINPNWTMESNLNLTLAVFNKGYSREIGYTSVTYLDITKTPIWNIPVQTNVPSVFTAYHSSIYHPSDKRLYFFGGVYQDLSQPNYNVSIFSTWHQFSYALYFDTTTNAWGNETLKGSILPSQRILHTTNLLPDSNTVLLYGGETLDNIVNDFCFTLDLTSFTWTQQNLVSNDGNDLVRTRHSVIDIDNKTIFVLFGLTSNEQPTSTPIALDVSKPSNLTYVSRFVSSFLPASSTNSTNQNGTVTSGNSSSDSGHSNGISSGAIAGIVVGVVAFLAIVGLAIFFYRRNNSNSKREQVPAAVTMEHDNHSQEPIDVNWDEIEKQYVEVPPNMNNSKPRESIDGTTRYSSSDEGINRTTGIHSTVNVPNAIDENPPPTRFVLKPDGAGH